MYPTTASKMKEYFLKIVHRSSLQNIIRVLAGILIFVIIVGFIGGTIKAVLDLQIFIDESVATGLRQMLINVLQLLAVIEILKTVMGYLSDGRVRVTYVVDTILIVMLNEVSSFWFTGNHKDFIPLISILICLIVIRLVTVRFSPSRYDMDE